MRRLILLVVFVGGLSAGGYYAYRHFSASAEPIVRTTPVTRGSLRMTVETTGSVTPLISVNVGCEVSGTVGELLADYNSDVKKDAVLARLKPELFEAELSQAQANVAAAQANARLAAVEIATRKRQYERLLKLQQTKNAAAEEVAAGREALDAAEARFAAAEASVKQAEAVRDLAQTKLDRSVIYAPMDGIVLSRLVDVGQTVAAALTSPVLFVMAPDLDRMQVHANVSEADIGRVRNDQPCTFTVDAYPGREFAGTVVQVRNNPETRQGVVTYTVVIEVDNRAMLLKPGMTANVTIEVARRDNVPKISNAALRFRPPLTPEEISSLTENLTWPAADPPAAATRPASGGIPGHDDVLPRTPSVLWSYENKRWKPVPVLLGITDNRETEVLGGLDSGDAAVISVQMPAAGFDFKEALRQATPQNRTI